MEIATTQKLKSLETRKTRVIAELDALKEERKRVCHDCSVKERELAMVKQAIKDLVDPEIASGPVITEHAMLRYVQRVWGIDLKEIADEILPGNVIEQIKVLGPGRYPVNSDSGTHHLVVKDGKILTVEVD